MEISFKDVDEYKYELFALDTLDYFTLKISEGDKDKALFLKKMIGDSINNKYNKSHHGFLGFDVRNLDSPFSSVTNNDVWEMFKWLYINKDTYALSTHYKLKNNDSISKRVVAFNKNVEVLDYYTIIEEMANDICFTNFTDEQGK